jgi:hypothetical protein
VLKTRSVENRVVLVTVCNSSTVTSQGAKISRLKREILPCKFLALVQLRSLRGSRSRETFSYGRLGTVD